MKVTEINLKDVIETEEWERKGVYSDGRVYYFTGEKDAEL